MCQIKYNIIPSGGGKIEVFSYCVSVFSYSYSWETKIGGGPFWSCTSADELQAYYFDNEAEAMEKFRSLDYPSNEIDYSDDSNPDGVPNEVQKDIVRYSYILDAEEFEGLDEEQLFANPRTLISARQ